MKNMDKRQKILIVDDSNLNRDILKEILGDTYNYLEAENGNQAIQMIGENIGIDLMLLDINMPQMNGFEVFYSYFLFPLYFFITVYFYTYNHLHHTSEAEIKEILKSLYREKDRLNSYENQIPIDYACGWALSSDDMSFIHIFCFLYISCITVYFYTYNHLHHPITSALYTTYHRRIMPIRMQEI